MNRKELEEAYLRTLRENEELRNKIIKLNIILFKDNPKLYYDTYYTSKAEIIEELKKEIAEKDKEILRLKNKLLKKKSKNSIKNITASEEYKKFRQEILVRDNHKCALCGSDFRLQVHHKKPKNKYPDLIMDPDNCITLCITCHSKTDSFFN